MSRFVTSTTYRTVETMHIWLVDGLSVVYKDRGYREE